MRIRNLVGVISLTLSLFSASFANAGPNVGGGDEMPQGPIWDCVSTTQTGVTAKVTFQGTLLIRLANGETHSFPKTTSPETEFVFDGSMKPIGFTKTFLVKERELAQSTNGPNDSKNYFYSETTKPLPNRGFVAALSVYLNQVVESKNMMGNYRARMSISISTQPVFREEMLCTYSTPAAHTDPLNYVIEH